MGIMTSLLLKKNTSKIIIGCCFGFENCSSSILVLILISNLLKIRALVSILVLKEANYAYWFWFRSSKPTSNSILVTISTQNIQFRTSLPCVFAVLWLLMMIQHTILTRQQHSSRRRLIQAAEVNCLNHPALIPSMLSKVIPSPCIANPVISAILFQIVLDLLCCNSFLKLNQPLFHAV